MESNRLNFFADINRQIFVIIGGLLAIATIIPIFINKIGSIFGIPIQYSYYLFVFLYFIFPVIFYLLYCSIYDYVGFLKLIPDRIYGNFTPRAWKAIELMIILGVFWWLCWGNIDYKWTCSLLYILSIAIFIVFLINPSYKGIRGTKREFIIIGVTVIAIFSLFFFTEERSVKNLTHDRNLAEYNRSANKKGDNANDVAFALFQKQKAIENSLLKPTDSLIANFQKGILRVSVRYPSRNLSYVRLNSIDSFRFNKAFDAVTRLERTGNIVNINLSTERNVILTNTNLIWPRSDSLETRGDTCFRIYSTFLSLQSYLQSVAREKNEYVKKYWAILLSNLQVKGLSWFFFLVIVCLCLWLHSMKELAEIYKKRAIANEIKAKVLEWQTQKINDNSDQIRSLFYVVVLLVMPFFKTIDEKTISLTMPFVDFGIQKYYDSNNNSSGIAYDYTDEFKEIRKQLAVLEEFTRIQQNENNKNRERLRIISQYTIRGIRGQEEYEAVENK
jgi:hypothetical protein